MSMNFTRNVFKSKNNQVQLSYLKIDISDILNVFKANQLSAIKHLYRHAFQLSRNTATYLREPVLK